MSIRREKQQVDVGGIKCIGYPDTGTERSILPRSLVQRLGLRPVGDRVGEVANGRRIKLTTYDTTISIGGKCVRTRVVGSNRETRVPLVYLGYRDLKRLGMKSIIL